MAISLPQAIGLVITIAIIGIVLGAMATTLNSFSDTQVTEGYGCNSTSGNYSACSPAYYVIVNSTQGIGNFAVQMPVIGTIAAVAVIITLVVGGLMVFGDNKR